MTMPAVRIDALLAGIAKPYTRPGSCSAIDKHPLDGTVAIGESGIAGDQQGDPRVHGGADKAIHHYAFDHYQAWRDELGARPLLQAPGAFGENISTVGLDEDNVCLGDRFLLGTALIEVSQGRQPCWKLNDRFDVPDMARRVQSSGRTGWYYRVLQPGAAEAGELLRLDARPYPGWTLRRLGTLLFDRVLARESLEPALQLPLVPSWRKLLERRLQLQEIEDWHRRIDGPDRH